MQERITGAAASALDAGLVRLRQAASDLERAEALQRRVRRDAVRRGLSLGDDGREVAAWALAHAAAERRTSALRTLGMPVSVVPHRTGRYAPAKAGVVGVRWARWLGREHLVFGRHDADGRLHAEDGPAAVTDRGDLLFLRAGRFSPGPHGFCAITADGVGYRGAEQAANRFARLVETVAPGRTTTSCGQTRGAAV